MRMFDRVTSPKIKRDDEQSNNILKFDDFQKFILNADTFINTIDE